MGRRSRPRCPVRGWRGLCAGAGRVCTVAVTPALTEAGRDGGLRGGRSPSALGATTAKPRCRTGESTGADPTAGVGAPPDRRRHGCRLGRAVGRGVRGFPAPGHRRAVPRRAHEQAHRGRRDRPRGDPTSSTTRCPWPRARMAELTDRLAAGRCEGHRVRPRVLAGVRQPAGRRGVRGVDRARGQRRCSAKASPSRVRRQGTAPAARGRGHRRATNRSRTGAAAHRARAGEPGPGRRRRPQHLARVRHASRGTFIPALSLAAVMRFAGRRHASSSCGPRASRSATVSYPPARDRR